MKHTLKTLFAGSALALLVSLNSGATPLTINFNADFDLVGSGDLGANHSEIPYHTEENKNDPGNEAEEGTATAYYEALWTYDVSDGDSATVVISHIGVSSGDTTPPTNYIVNPVIYIKAGQSLYVYDPTNADPDKAQWDGWMPLTINGITRTSGVGAISHVDIAGVVVPDGGSSMALFGVSLMGLVGLLRVVGSRKA